jgi:hypothetical protein
MQPVQVRGSCLCLVTGLIFYGERLLALRSTPQTGGPHLVVRPRLLIQSILSYQPHLEMRQVVVTRDPPNMIKPEHSNFYFSPVNYDVERNARTFQLGVSVPSIQRHVGKDFRNM